MKTKKMTSLSIRMMPTDFPLFTQAAKKHKMSRSGYFRIVADHVAAEPARPRNVVKIPIENQTETSVSADIISFSHWRAAAMLARLPFHMWVRECVIPFGIAWETPILHDVLDDSLTLHLSPNQTELYRSAAESQGMEMIPWIVTQLKLAADYHLSHRIMATPPRPPGPDMEFIMRQAAEFAAEEKAREEAEARARKSTIIPISEFTPEQIAEAERPEEP